MPALCLSLILLSFVVGLPATLLARALGRKLNALDAAGVPGQVKAPPRRVPNTGGVGIFLAVALPALAGVFTLPLIENAHASNTPPPIGPTFLSELGPYMHGVRQQTPAALILLTGLLVLHIAGLIDDRKPLGPGVKLLVMLAVAAAVTHFTDTRLLTLVDKPVGGHWLSTVVTVLWIVIITNAFNFLDNMDGLSAGVGAVCSTFFLITALVGGQWFVAAMLALLLGALLAFLVFNFPWKPSGATIFMGDGGSLVLGFLLGVLSVRITYLPTANALAPTSPPPHSFLVLTPLIILAIPLYDFASVCLIRISQGRSPFVGDLQHFSHRLVKHGLSRRTAVLVIYGAAAVTGIGAIALPKLEPWQAALVGVQALLVLLVIALYEWASTPPGAEPPAV